MRISWLAVNYTGAFAGITLLTMLVAFGLWRSVTPESDTWLPLGMAALMLATVTLIYARKLLQQPRASEGIGAAAVFTLMLGLLASGLWTTAVTSVDLQVDTGFKAALLLPCLTGISYLVLVAVDCISTERKLLKRK